ncbi:hypothetical protein [Streptomyces marincola]|nr:hypothetical protein [Streptomyces marincola]
MAADLYEPLFPGGSDVEIAQSFERFEQQPTRWCRLRVDGDIILNADAADRGGIDDVNPEAYDVDPADAQDVPGEYEAAVWPGLAVATVPCTVPGPGPGNHHYIENLTLILETEHPGDDDESREALAGVIQPLFAGALEMTPCEEHAAR